jgi:hypothetical protein
MSLADRSGSAPEISSTTAFRCWGFSFAGLSQAEMDFSPHLEAVLFQYEIP